MPNHGGSYLFVVAGALWSVLLCVFLLIIAKRLQKGLSPRLQSSVQPTEQPDENPAWLHGVNPRSTLILIILMVVFSLGLLLIPLSIASVSVAGEKIVLPLILIAFLSLGIAYAVRKRDLFWKKELKDS